MGADTSANANANDSSAGRPAASRTARIAMLKQVLTVALVVVVLALVIQHARSVDWPAVLSSLRGAPPELLWMGAALSAGCYALFCSYDLLGRRLSGHTLTTAQVAGVSFTCYAFNLNLGSLVGGIALRYRLYGRLGLATSTVSEIILLSLMTNWLGYLFLGGVVFAVLPLALPPDWPLDREQLRWLGGALLAAAAAYLAACTFSRRRVLQVRQTRIHLPAGRIALLQGLLSSLCWTMNAGIAWLMLRQQVDYPTVLGVLLVGAVAGILTHVPAGLGVLEAVFVALLGHRVPPPDLIAALLAYRGLYYLAPLAIAAVGWLAIDAGARRGAGRHLTVGTGGRERLRPR